MKLKFSQKSVYGSFMKTETGIWISFSVFARNVKSKTNIKFSFPFSQKSCWPLGTRILKSVFVVVVKRKHEIGISSKIHFLVLHANGFWQKSVFRSCTQTDFGNGMSTLVFHFRKKTVGPWVHALSNFFNAIFESMFPILVSVPRF